MHVVILLLVDLEFSHSIEEGAGGQFFGEGERLVNLYKGRTSVKQLFLVV